MPTFITITTCFLLCLGHHHVRHSPHSPHAEPCAAIATAYDDYANSWSNGYGSVTANRDEFVKRYPANAQHRVLVCLDKTGRGQH